MISFSISNIKEFKNKGYFISRNFLKKDSIFSLQKSLSSSLNECLQREVFKLIIKKKLCLIKN